MSLIYSSHVPHKLITYRLTTSKDQSDLFIFPNKTNHICLFSNKTRRKDTYTGFSCVTAAVRTGLNWSYLLLSTSQGKSYPSKHEFYGQATNQTSSLIFCVGRYTHLQCLRPISLHRCAVVWECGKGQTRHTDTDGCGQYTFHLSNAVCHM